MPTLWRVFAKRSLAGDELLGSENAKDKMPSVRESQSVERMASGYALRQVAALSLPRLCPTVFHSVKVFSDSSFFSIFLKKDLLPFDFGDHKVFVSSPTMAQWLKQQEL